MPLSSALAPFTSLRNPVFARLYAAQTTFLDTTIFLISGVLIFTLPAQLRTVDAKTDAELRVRVAAVLEGTNLLWKMPCCATPCSWSW